MTIPNKYVDSKQTQEVPNTETPVENKDTPQEDLKLSQEQPKDSKKISVDIGNGVTVELDYEQGKKYIQYRDTRTKGYKELEAKLKSAEETAKQEKSRAELLEAIKKQSVEEVESMVSAKYVEKLNRIQSKVIDKEIENVFKSREDFIKDYSQDALKLFKSEYVVTLDENENPIANGKSLEDAAKEFLEKKEIFRKATVKGTGNGPTIPIRSVNKVPQPKAKIDLSKAVGNAFKIK